MWVPCLIGSLVFGIAEELTWIEALYWGVQTSTTVGFGDVAMTKRFSQWFVLFWVPVMV